MIAVTDNQVKTVGDASAIAADYRRRGLALCKPNRGTKSPLYEGWGTRSLEPGDFATDDLIGILGGPLSACNRPGHALVPLDLDAKEALEKADEYLPPTGMEEGRPGKARDHRYYLVPVATVPAWAESPAEQAALAARQTTGHPGPWKKAFSHTRTKKRILDFHGTGGQVVCPSPGNHRAWVGGAPGEPAVVPFTILWDGVCKLALACGAKAPDVDEQPAEPSSSSSPDPAAQPHRWDELDPHLQRRVLAYIKKIDPAISGCNGHSDTLWAVRPIVRGFDLGELLGFDVLWKHWNPRCQPPWSEAELRHKCHEAATLPFRKPVGWLLQEPERHLTDRGNSERVVEEHGEDLRYCHPRKHWLVYNERHGRWAEDDTAEIVRRVKDTQRGLYRWAADKINALGDVGDDQERKGELAKLNAVLKHALKWEDARAIGRCLTLMTSEPDIPILTSQLDADPFLLNVLNGTIDLRTGELRPHRREDYLTKLCPVEYRPGATCGLWERFLWRVLAENEDLIGYLQRVIGYALTADVREQCLWFLYGPGSNGKSTFIAVLLALLGDYGIQAVSELLLAKSREAHPTERADLFGKRFVATVEVDEGKRMAESLMKQLTGGDKMRARSLYQNFFEFDQTWKILLAVNHKPTVHGTDHAVWRRIKLVPFTVTIPDEEKDKDLLRKLKGELPGILKWAIQGCLEWQRHGLGEPEEVTQATDAYRAEQDILEAFLTECCIRMSDARIRSSALLEEYHRWSGEKTMTPMALADQLAKRGFERRKGADGCMYWHGIGLPASGRFTAGHGTEGTEAVP
jgi:putative DNA primase/helicase